MKVLPGSSKEGVVVSMPDGFGIPEGAFLVMGGGYPDGRALAQIKEKGLEYVVSVERDPGAYGITDARGGMFYQGKSAVAQEEGQEAKAPAPEFAYPRCRVRVLINDILSRHSSFSVISKIAR